MRRPTTRGWNPASALAIPGLTAAGLPVVSPEGFTPLGAAEPVPFWIRTSSYQVLDSVSWKSARHSWQFGFQGIRRQDDGNASEWSSRGDFTFTPDYTGYPGIGLTGDSIASLLTGYPSELTVTFSSPPFTCAVGSGRGSLRMRYGSGGICRLRPGSAIP